MSTTINSSTSASAGSIDLESMDLIRFAPIAFKQAIKKGFLQQVRHQKSQIDTTSNNISVSTFTPLTFFYCLYGNFLYTFLNNYDPNSLRQIYFLESSSCRLLLLDNPILSITTISGQIINLSGDVKDLNEWHQAIEDNKVKSLLRKQIDNELLLTNLKLKDEQNDKVIVKYENILDDNDNKMNNLKNIITNLMNRNNELNIQNDNLSKMVKDIELKNILLLSSKGISPKIVPSWAQVPPTNPSAASTPGFGKKKGPGLNYIRIWTGTWNMNGKDPLSKPLVNPTSSSSSSSSSSSTSKSNSTSSPSFNWSNPAISGPTSSSTTTISSLSFLNSFIPYGYDLYILGLQECLNTNNNITLMFDNYFGMEGYVRVDLSDALLSFAGSHGNKTGSNLSMTSTGGVDPTKVSNLSSTVSLTTLIYIRNNLKNDLKVLAINSIPLTNTSSRGIVGIILSMLGRIICVVNSHLDNKSNEIRREQYQNIVMNLGNNLGENDFHLNEQFHHIFWLGDLNYPLVYSSKKSNNSSSTSSNNGNNNLPLDFIKKNLLNSSQLKELYTNNDQLNIERLQLQLVFYQYREPTPISNFLPNWRRKENRLPIDYSNKDWLNYLYEFETKQPFYKGGKVKENLPRFSSRILYYSMSDMAEDLVPEVIDQDFVIIANKNDDESGWDTLSYMNPTGLNASTSSNTTLSNSRNIRVKVHNYKTINDAEGYNCSSYAPVSCTFLLRLRHDHDLAVSQITSGITSTSNTSSTSSTSVASSVTTSITTSSTIVEETTTPTRSISTTRTTSTSITSNESKRLSRSSKDITNLKNNKKKDLQIISPNSSSSSLPSPRVPLTPSNTSSPLPNSPTSPSSIPPTVSERFSLLPFGLYRIRLSNIKLIWGGQESYPISSSLLFPSPYEAVAGERFAQFQSDQIICSLSTLNAITNRNSLWNSASSSNPSSPIKNSSNNNNNQTTNSNIEWKRAHSSKTGTSMVLTVDRTHYPPLPPSPASNLRESCFHRDSYFRDREESEAEGLPDVTLIWRGEEPLDRLHISLKVSMPSHSIFNNPNKNLQDVDLVTGHCVLSLEQLCKVALAINNSQSKATPRCSIARPLVQRGRPMHAIDPRTMQRELVTLTCLLELLPHEVA